MARTGNHKRKKGGKRQSPEEIRVANERGAQRKASARAQRLIDEREQKEKRLVRDFLQLKTASELLNLRPFSN